MTIKCLQSESDQKRWKRWKQAILAAEMLSEIDRKGGSIDEIVQCLDHVEEFFPKTLDPVDELEAYSFRQFVKAVRSALERVQKDTDSF